MANSFKQMIKNGTIKRRDDGMYIQLSNIFIEEGFNDRVDDEYTRAANEELYLFMKNGGQVPAMEVVPRDEGGVLMREGHRRTLNYNRLQSEGEPIEWVHITPCKGNDIDQQARVMNSASQLKLRFFEEANNVKKMMAFNLSPSEIAVKVSRSLQHVNKLIRFIEANHDVQTLARTQPISLDVIIDRLDSHGSKAGIALAADVEKARKKGKKRVTRSVANTVFSAARARRLCELLFDASPMLREEGDVLLLTPGTREEINKILNEYRQQNPAQEASDDQAL